MSLVILQEVVAGVGKILLNDPSNLNAMSEAMASEFAAIVHQLRQQEPKPRVIILSGSGRAFSAGGDLDMLEKKSTLSREENKRRMLAFYNSFLGIRDLGIPIIAAINGHAIGAGLCVASACDIRVCSDSAKLGFTFAKLGLHPGMGATFFLPKVIGIAAATELMMTGRIIEAQEALRIGLVSRVCSGDQLNLVAEEIAQEIIACGPLAITQLCHSLRTDSAVLIAALDREAECQSENYSSSEFLEGVRAVRDKRKADFSKC